MINKIKCIIDKIKERYKYDMCYTKQEELGVAIFEMCNACNDKSCPYYTDTGKDYTDTGKEGVV